MGYDGSITFKTGLDNSEIKKDLDKVERDIQKSQEKIAKAEYNKLPLERQLESVTGKIEKSENKLLQYQKRLSELQNVMLSTGRGSSDYQNAAKEVPEVVQEITAQQEKIKKLEAEWKNVNKQVESYDKKISEANYEIETATKKAQELNSALLTPNQEKMQAAFEKADKSAKKFRNRLLEIGKSALIFNLISSGLRSVVSYMGKALKTNSEYTAQLAQLKGALLTAFQPIYEYVLPGLITVLKVLTNIVQFVANVIATLFGKTAQQSAANAKALYDEAGAIASVGNAAEEARTQIMGFDEVNKLESTSTSSGGISGGIGSIQPDFSAFDTDQYKKKIDELTAYLSTALLALGAILTFSGANIPLGIALMAVGAIGLATVASENWDYIREKLSGSLGGIVALLSTFLLPLGAILAFSGVNVPLGIALMAVGAAGLALTKNVSWGVMDEEIKREVTSLTTLLGVSLLAMGAILAFSGVNIPLGIAMIATGGFALATAASLNWDAIPDKCKEVWKKITTWFSTNVAPKLTLSYWQEKFSTIATALEQKIKDGLNSAAARLNAFINSINAAMKFTWGDFSINGRTIISAGSWQLFTIPNVPYLAEGGVIPPNAPFMAVLGDQKSGTNIEAPLDTIKQAVAEVLAEAGGTTDVNIEFTGSLSELARLLAPKITTEQRRTKIATGG